MFSPKNLGDLGDLCERPFLIILFSITITIIRGSSFSQFLILNWRPWAPPSPLYFGVWGVPM